MKLFTILLMLIMFVPIGLADYEISWYTIDGGGGESTGEEYVLNGTIGKFDAGVSSGNDYVLYGGFWPGVTGSGCIVDITDLAILADHWLAEGTDLIADLDGNNRVDIADFAELSYWWHNTCPTDWPLK